MNLLVLADIVWPALYLADRMLAIEVVILGLCLEAIVFRRAFSLTWKRAFLVTAAINAVSTMIGTLLLPIWGWYWAAAMAERDANYGWGTFNIISWTETWCFAWLLTTLVEWLPLRLIAGKQKRLILVLLAANGLSVGIAGLSFFLVAPPRDPLPYIDLFQFLSW